jgi:hypothetical protein
MWKDLSCRNIAFTESQLSTLSLDDLYKTIGAPLCEELVRLDGTSLGPSLPKYLIEAANWDYWTDEDDEDIRIFDFSNLSLLTVSFGRLLNRANYVPWRHSSWIISIIELICGAWDVL